MTNLKVINAPAGSGKSYEIKRRVREWTASNPLDKLLCVTYTNRAADELSQEISSASIEVSTIHSFLDSFSKSMFGAPEIIELYFETYREAIEERIENAGRNSSIEESNARYVEKLGRPLTYENIVTSIDRLYYNERPFTTLYRGGLSHDDLLSFITICAKRYPTIYKKIGLKYRQIIIDEYQDTNVDVLDFFMAAVSGTDCDLVLYGDKMQQIYKSDPFRFRKVLDHFDEEAREVINYRSSPEIVSVLNAIYNDKKLVQTSALPDTQQKPRIHFASDPSYTEAQLVDDETLVLTIHNSAIFASIKALELLRALQAMPDHGFNSRYAAVTVLTEPEWDKVQNPLIRLLYGLLTLEELFHKRLFGNIIKILNRYPKDFGTISLSSHTDKSHLSTQLDSLFITMSGESVAIKEVITKLSELEINKPADISAYIDQESYNELINIPFSQVRHAFEFRKDPKRSTQHGVKGESHEKVVFIAETSKHTPVVHVSKLFDIWPRLDIGLDELESFQADISNAFCNARQNIGIDISTIPAAAYAPFKEISIVEAERIMSAFDSSFLFTELYKPVYEKYLDRPTATNAKALLKQTPIDGLLSAYRLFYVGCSRARTQLDVIISVDEVFDISACTAKFINLGFDVINPN